MWLELSTRSMAAQEVVSNPPLKRHTSQGWEASWWTIGVVTKHCKAKSLLDKWIPPSCPQCRCWTREAGL